MLSAAVLAIGVMLSEKRRGANQSVGQVSVGQVKDENPGVGSMNPHLYKKEAVTKLDGTA